MEWAVLILFGIVATALIGMGPLEVSPAVADPGPLREQRDRLLRELRDLDDDAAAGRISATDRHEGRLAIAPELRLVTERLRELGDGTS
jgi:hypothetical protein